MYGIIDIGSNTIRLTIYRAEGERFRVLVSQKVMAGLANFVEDGRLTFEGIERACRALEEFDCILENMRVDAVRVFATASLRNVANGGEVAGEIRQRTGFPVDIIPGEEEARLDFLGAMVSVHTPDGVLVDIGGGSTEVVTYHRHSILEARSIPVGSLNLFRRHVQKFLPKGKEVRAILEEIHQQCDQGDLPVGDSPVLCGVGGTVRAALRMSNYLFGLPMENGIITVEHLRTLTNTLLERGETARRLILKICPERIHTLLPGLLVLGEMARRYDCELVVVSRFGVREGYLIDRLLQRGDGHGAN